eukprot:6206384-Pleurochrysis_carterae.AAC.1
MLGSITRDQGTDKTLEKELRRSNENAGDALSKFMGVGELNVVPAKINESETISLPAQHRLVKGA